MRKSVPVKTEKAVDSVDSSPHYTDLALVLDLRSKNLSYRKIGKITGQSPQAVHQMLKRRAPELLRLESYKRNRADLFALKGMQILESVDRDAIKECSAYQRTLMVGILHDKEMVERGKASGQGVVNVQINLSTPQDVVVSHPECGLSEPGRGEGRTGTGQAHLPEGS